MLTFYERCIMSQNCGHNQQNDVTAATVATVGQPLTVTTTNSTNHASQIAHQTIKPRSDLLKAHLPADLGGTDGMRGIIKNFLFYPIANVSAISDVYYVGHQHDLILPLIKRI